MLCVCPHGHRGCKWLCSRLKTSGVLIQPWFAWPSATRSYNVYVEGTSQTHRLNTEVKSYELRQGMSQTWGVSANCYKPVARRRVRGGQEQPSGVRRGMPWFTVGQTTPPGWLDTSNMAAMPVETDRDRQQRLHWPDWLMWSQLIPAFFCWHHFFLSMNLPMDGGAYFTGCPNFCSLLNISV